MKKSLCTLMIFFATVSCYAQKLPWFLNHDGSQFPYSPLYVIHTDDKTIKTCDYTVFNELLAPYIDSLKILKPPAAVKLYGPRAKYGAIILRYRDEVALDTINRVNLYDLIVEMDMGIKTLLPIYVDHIYIKYPKDVYMNKEHIVSVEQRTEKAYHNATYFSVITTKFIADSIKTDSSKRISITKKVVDTTKRLSK
ncbi:MAG: hypothetical protein ACTHNW_20595 [Mucilaginibacter sp.]